MVRPILSRFDRDGMTQEPSEAFHDILRGVAALTRNPVAADIARLYGKGAPVDLSIAVNHKQIASKQWLVETLAVTLPRPDGPVWVLGAWYGVLGALLLEEPQLAISEVVSLDIDPGCATVAETLNHRHVAAKRFRAITADMIGLDFAAQVTRPGLVINASISTMCRAGLRPCRQAWPCCCNRTIMSASPITAAASPRSRRSRSRRTCPRPGSRGRCRRRTIHASC
jgi:hypothetical protein